MSHEATMLLWGMMLVSSVNSSLNITTGVRVRTYCFLSQLDEKLLAFKRDFHNFQPGNGGQKEKKNWTHTHTNSHKHQKSNSSNHMIKVAQNFLMPLDPLNTASTPAPTPTDSTPINAWVIARLNIHCIMRTHTHALKQRRAFTNYHTHP